MGKLWFIYLNEVVRGPFSTDEVKHKITTQMLVPEMTLIWWRGQKSWVPLEVWVNHLPEIMEALSRKPQDVNWYAEQSGEQYGPMSHNEIVQFLKRRNTLDRIHLWREGMDRWTSLFEIEDMVEELGLQRRKMPRAPIVGSVKIKNGSKQFITEICELSAGGVGIRSSDSLVAGDTVMLSIESPLLVAPIRTTAQVAYVKTDGFAGLEFDNIHIESKSTIIDYVRQFHERTQPKKPQAA